MHLLFDIGGTNMRLGTSQDGETIDNFEVSPTPQDYAGGLALIQQFTAKFDTVDKVAGGIAGTFDPERKRLLSAPHLGDWAGKNIRDDLAELAGTDQVLLENDAAMVGLGEATIGAGKQHVIVAYITISTGVGGARLVDKQIDRTHLSFEPGHQIVDATKLTRLEELISGSGIEKMTGRRADEIKDAEFWTTTHDYAAIGIANTVLHWSPQVVVLGGGMVSGGHIQLAEIERRLPALLKVYPQIPEIRQAELGEKAGLHGALQLLRYTS